MLALLLQTTPVAPIVKGTGLPPPADDEAAVLAPLRALTDGIAARDPAAIAAAVPADARLVQANELPDGTRRIKRLTGAEFAAGIKPGPERYREAEGMPAVEIDGDIAMVWVPYTFLIDGTPHHCGINHVDLVRDSGRWRIQSITWSQRTTGCVAP